MYKDHKAGDKTRPTATGHSSNSLGLSNAVSEVLEAVSNSENKRYNTISSEDMLARVTEYNKKVADKNIKWEMAFLLSSVKKRSNSGLFMFYFIRLFY